MCLAIEKGTVPTIAQDNLVVYKVYRKTKIGSLRSFYQLAKTKLGKQPKVEMITDTHPIRFKNGIGGVYKGYHSFTSLEDTTNFIKNVNFSVNDAIYNGSHIYQCTIPKGSLYYKGLFQNKYESFASEQLIVGKEITIN